MTIKELENVASQVRRDIVRMVHACQSGHPGGSLGCTDYFVALYFHILRHDPDFKMDGKLDFRIMRRMIIHAENARVKVWVFLPYHDDYQRLKN